MVFIEDTRVNIPAILHCARREALGLKKKNEYKSPSKKNNSTPSSIVAMIGEKKAV